MKKDATTLNTCWNCEYCHGYDSNEYSDMTFLCVYKLENDDRNIVTWYDNHAVTPNMICKNHIPKIE